jgi:hypothetical protein
MWSRVVEIMLGCWLLISPFVFGHPVERGDWWVTDLSGGFAAMLFAALSWWPPTRHAHLLTALLGAVLIALAYRYYGDAPPAAQNEALTGLLLMMFAVIPNHASAPPASWQRVIHGFAARPHPLGRDRAIKSAVEFRTRTARRGI